MIRAATQADFERILAVINDGAQAYRGAIPPACWHEPYLSAEALRGELADRVQFWVMEEGPAMLGVMGIQHRHEVTLVRHAYTATAAQRRGIGSSLLRHLESLTAQAMLIGTWADATWAIRFYRARGYRVLSTAEKNRLLRRYWSVPERQMETSVVLADYRWPRNASTPLSDQ